MSNSPLVNYAKRSPNRNAPRKHAIDTITIHCMAGNMTVEGCGDWFGKMSTAASSNYGVGTDGRVGLYVDEADRSWCSSSESNDHRAVTIEVANDGGAPDWHVSDKAMAALIALVADICKRNGIKRLVWSTDKNARVNHLNGCNMTVHRDYANKSCPGDYLYGKHGYIADEVNKRLGVTATPAPTVPAPAATSGDETIWNFLIGKGLSPYAAAGLMGNLYAESGLKSNNLQNSFEKSPGFTDESYTAAVDGGKYANFVKDGAGYGLAQWTYYTRKQALLDFAKAAKKSIGDLQTQLDFLWKELQGYSGVMSVLKSAKNILEASNAVLLQFERPADQSLAVQLKRSEYGRGYYEKFAGRAATIPPTMADAFFSKQVTPYIVLVTADSLNYRTGPGTNYKAVGTVTKGGMYTIVEEADGAGASKWGKLKSGAGWISLDYCKRK